MRQVKAVLDAALDMARNAFGASLEVKDQDVSESLKVNRTNREIDASWGSSDSTGSQGSVNFSSVGNPTEIG